MYCIQLTGCKEECILVDSEGKGQTSHSHRAVNCTFYMSVQYLGSICAECSVLRRNLSVQLVRFNASSGLMSNTHARCPMEKSEGHWTFLLSNGSIELLIFHCTLECPFDPMHMEKSIGI